MAEFLSSLKLWITPSKIKTESYTSPLFYQVTFGVCVTTFIVHFGCTYFGDAIECHNAQNSKTLNSHCWKVGTKRILDDDISHCSDYRVTDSELNDERPLMTYYAWIPWILLMNGIVFQIPHRIWKILEGGRIKSFYSEEANKIHLVGENEDILQKNSQTFIQIMDSLKWYHTKFFICQFLNILIVSIIFAINDAFLQNGFFNYGALYIQFSLGYAKNENYFNPLCDVFPTRTSCDDNTGGPANGVNIFNVKCEMNHNFANQYIFLILWFWYIFLFVIGIIQLMFESVCILVPAFRKTLLKWKLPSGSNLNSKQFTLGQWFLLFQISRNMDQIFFFEFFRRVSEEKYKQTANNEAIPLNQMTNGEV